jgi:hypothetical protein
VVPASDYRALSQVRELQRLLGKKTLEVEILKEVPRGLGGVKRHLLRLLLRPMTSASTLEAHISGARKVIPKSVTVDSFVM